jgi:hypothetical protein
VNLVTALKTRGAAEPDGWLTLLLDP